MCRNHVVVFRLVNLPAQTKRETMGGTIFRGLLDWSNWDELESRRCLIFVLGIYVSFGLASEGR
jgi:hypothetical protein